MTVLDLILQSPIFCRARLAMRLFHIHLGDTGIMLHHIQTAMSQQQHKCENITARSQIRDRERMWRKR
jgi:hypothetical protein